MLQRTAHLTRARLAMARRSGWPIPALGFHALVAAVLALLVRDVLPPFPYALFALSTGGLFFALPLLTDLAAILRRDEGREWIAALPVEARELRLARTAQLLAVLGALVCAWFAPFALLAPATVALGARLALPVLGFGFALFLATLAIWAQELLLARFERAFAWLHAVLVIGIVIGLVQILGHLPALAALEPAASGWLAFFPPAWFACASVVGGAAWLLAVGVSLASVLALLVLPAPVEPRSARRTSMLEAWLEPLRRLAGRAWVRSDELGTFELVFTALPREREIALRTAPLLGIPLAFLWLGAQGAHTSQFWRADLMALLFFTSGVYLPLLLTHVPLSESPQAVWILRTAPVSEGALVGGTIKALFVRWVLPLHLVLAALAIGLGAAELVVRLWLPSLLVALFLLRLLYPRCVHDLPLSTAPEELRSDLDWVGVVAPLAVGLTLLAVLANRFATWPMGAGAALVLLLIEVALERGLRRTMG